MALTSGTRLSAGDVDGNAFLVSLDDGHIEKFLGLKKDDHRSWLVQRQPDVRWLACGGQSHHGARGQGESAYGRAQRLARTEMPPIAGMGPEIPIITPDGATYAFGYRLRLSDLYTVSGMR